MHGHRGARGRRPENTLAGFEYAIALGVDAIELDVVLTRDGETVAMHDPRPELTFAELHAAMPEVPRLSEVLALAPRGEFLFNIELKPFADAAEIVERVLPLVEGMEGRVLFQSFDFEILRELNRRAPAIPRSAIFDDVDDDFRAIAERAHATAVSPDFHLATAEKVRAAHEAGVQVLAWTANSPDDWMALMEANVDAIITDYPAELMEYLGLLLG